MLKLSRFLSKIAKWALPALGVLLIFVILSEPTLAAETATSKGIWDTSLGWIANLFSFIIMLITLIAYVFALLVGDLLDSTYILDSGMGDTLHLVWTVMRNFVNIGFILILLVIAAMVIFGGGGEKGLGMLKKVLPKFILALVFVNLTFFAGRFILTTNDVLATAIFSLPKTVSGEKMIRIPCKAENWEECRKEISTKLTSGLASGSSPQSSVSSQDKVTERIKALSKDSRLVKIDEWVGKKNIALVLVSSMLDLQNLVYTKGVIAGGLSDVVISGIMAMITAGAIGIVIFMLLLALVVRMVVLWLCLAVSPVAALALVLGDIIPGANMKGDLDLLSIFIKHAFMPTLVAIPLSVGLIMIFANNAVGYDYKLNKLFSFADGQHAGDLHTLLWWIASIAVIWIGTNMMIKKSSDIAAKATDKIHGGVNKFVGAAAGTLKYAPIIPAFGGQSVSSLMRQPELMQAHVREISQRQEQKLAASGGYGSAAYAGLNKINNFGQTPTKEYLDKVLADPEAINQLLNSATEDAKAARRAFLEAAGFRVPENTELTPQAFQQYLQDNPTTSKSELGIEGNSGKELLKSLKRSSKQGGSAEEEKKNIEKETGVTSSRFGEKVEESRLTGNKKIVGKEELLEAKDKDNKIVFVKKNKGTGKLTIQLTAEDINQTIEVIDNETDKNKAGLAVRDVLNKLSKSKNLLTPEQKQEIEKRITSMFNDGLVHKNHVNDMKTAYQKVFGNTRLIDQLASKAVK